MYMYIRPQVHVCAAYNDSTVLQHVSDMASAVTVVSRSIEVIG